MYLFSNIYFQNGAPEMHNTVVLGISGGTYFPMRCGDRF